MDSNENPGTLRVGCLQGKPPFVDVVDNMCVGLLADVFEAAMNLTGYSYKMSMITPQTLTRLAQHRPICWPSSESLQPPNCIVSSSDIPTLMFNTNQSHYDIGITFTYVTAQRWTFVDSSGPIMEAYYTIMLGPRFVVSATNIWAATMDPAVLSLVCALFVVTLTTAITYFIAESTTKSSKFHKLHSHSERLFVCFMVAVDNLLGVGTVMEVIRIMQRNIAHNSTAHEEQYSKT